MNENNLGKIISNFRTERKMTQKELAHKLNVSDKAVSRWELGLSYPSMDMLLSLSKLFKIPLSELIIARVSTDEKNKDIVQEVVKHYSKVNNNYAKKVKKFLITLVIIVLIFTMTIIFTHSYNRFKVYRVNLESDDFYPTTGFYIETKIKDTLSLNNINIKGIELSSSDVISVDLYFVEDDKEYVIQSYSSLENINFVNYQSYVDIENLSYYSNNLYLRVVVMNSKGKTKKYTAKLNFILDFSNNKIFYTKEENKIDKKSINLTVDEIKEILLDNGFKESSDSALFYKKDDTVINYIIDSNKIRYTYVKNNFTYRYIYCLNNDILSVVIFDEENNTEIENYEYDVRKSKVNNCITGSCNNYKKVMGILNNAVLDLLK